MTSERQRKFYWSQSLAGQSLAEVPNSPCLSAFCLRGYIISCPSLADRHFLSSALSIQSIRLHYHSPGLIPTQSFYGYLSCHLLDSYKVTQLPYIIPPKPSFHNDGVWRVFITIVQIPDSEWFLVFAHQQFNLQSDRMTNLDHIVITPGLKVRFENWIISDFLWQAVVLKILKIVRVNKQTNN